MRDQRCYYTRRFLQYGDEFERVGVEAVWAEFEGVPSRQRLQARWQVDFSRHACAVEEDRDYPDVATEGDLDFQTDEITGVIEAPLCVFASAGQPFFTDDGDQYRAGGNPPR